MSRKIVMWFQLTPVWMPRSVFVVPYICCALRRPTFNTIQFSANVVSVKYTRYRGDWMASTSSKKKREKLPSHKYRKHNNHDFRILYSGRLTIA